VDVSVCIVNWNGREVLQACLESLRQPQGARLEVIVVDNGSTDGAADMVARDFPEVALVRNDHNAGFARGNNQAARLARGRYLLPAPSAGCSSTPRAIPRSAWWARDCAAATAWCSGRTAFDCRTWPVCCTACTWCV
jgi:hypothetical protein